MSFYSNLLDKVLFDGVKKPLVVILPLDENEWDFWQDSGDIFPANYEILKLPAVKIPENLSALSEQNRFKLAQNAKNSPQSSMFSEGNIEINLFEPLQELIKTRRPESL